VTLKEKESEREKERERERERERKREREREKEMFGYVLVCMSGMRAHRYVAAVEHEPAADYRHVPSPDTWDRELLRRARAHVSEHCLLCTQCSHNVTII
jgi:hypothetical protein